MNEGQASACPSTLDWAARLVVRGVNVIPLDAKRPRERWRRWQAERQADLPDGEDDAYLRLCFTTPANLGAVTGAVSGVVVADADSRAAWDALADACGGTLPRTVVSQTAKGRHVWFAHPGEAIGNRARVGGVELDVRGDGGYVVCPPSIHPDGTPYAWRRSPLEMWPPAPMPEPLLEMLRPTTVPPRQLSLVKPPAYAAAALAGEVDAVRTAPHGARNDTLNRAAFSLARLVRTGQLLAADVAEALVSAALAAGLSEHEARRTVASGLAGRRSA